MSEKKKSDVEDLRDVLKTVSEEIPALVKGVIGSIFSGEAGKNMGAAAANFYKELKAAGMPDEVAVRMTENYVKTFTDMGNVIKEVMSQKGGFAPKHREEAGKTVAEEIRKKVQEETSEKEE